VSRIPPTAPPQAMPTSASVLSSLLDTGDGGAAGGAGNMGGAGGGDRDEHIKARPPLHLTSPHFQSLDAYVLTQSELVSGWLSAQLKYSGVVPSVQRKGALADVRLSPIQKS